MPIIVGGLVGLFLLALWLYVIFEVISTDSVRCRNLPKPLWLLLVIFLPEIGSVAWLLLGRPENKRFGSSTGFGSTTAQRRSAPLGIEDRADWPDVVRKLNNDPEPPTVDPEIEKQRIRDAADERVRKLREWESRLIQREKALNDRDKSGDPKSND